MVSTLDQYREAKSTYMKLREQAKKDLLARFHAISDELLQIQRELREDFGHRVSIPTKPKPGRARKKAAPAAAVVKTPSIAPNPTRIAAIEKRIAVHKRKMEEAEKAGRVPQSIKDRLYEMEDELRLARESG